jgi:hypothetical protein
MGTSLAIRANAQMTLLHKHNRNHAMHPEWAAYQCLSEYANVLPKQ